jgi:hypothetical protein
LASGLFRQYDIHEDSPQLRTQGMAADMGTHGPGSPENMMFLDATFIHKDPCQDALRELQED